MFEPFFLRALAAGIGLAIVAAPLGSLVVWNRMAYFGEAVSQASLIGIALGLMLHLNLTFAAFVVTLVVAGLLILASRQTLVPLDALLGLMHHGTLALGIILMSVLPGTPVDLMGYLFGDIFAVTEWDLIWVFAGGGVVLAVLWAIWEPMLRLAVHAELAAAEGVNQDRIRAIFIVLLAATIAIAIKIMGALLVIAFLIVPAVAARPFSATPERMVLLSGVAGIGSVVAGLGLSNWTNAPGGPAIVLIMSVIAAGSLLVGAVRAR